MSKSEIRTLINLFEAQSYSPDIQQMLDRLGEEVERIVDATCSEVSYNSHTGDLFIHVSHVQFSPATFKQLEESVKHLNDGTSVEFVCGNGTAFKFSIPYLAGLT